MFGEVWWHKIECFNEKGVTIESVGNKALYVRTCDMFDYNHMNTISSLLVI